MRKMFSKKQIAEMVGDGLLEDQDVKVKTIEQSEANFKIDLEEISMSGLGTGLEYTPIYSKFELINGILYLVLTFKLKNTTASAVSPGNCYLEIANFPSNVGDKIIDFNGNKLSEAAISDLSTNISCDYGFASDSSYESALNRTVFKCVLDHPAQNQMNLNFYDLQNVGANKSQIYSFRTFLSIL